MSADWFHRLCLINGVEWSADPELGDCVICTDGMTAVDSIEVPCCRQFAHVVCLARSFSSRGVDCPFCNQSLAVFARSSSFMASALFHGCMIDFDLPPSNQGLNSLVLPSGFPRPPDSMAVLCCRRVGPPPQFEELSDRRMEWSPSHHVTSDQWSPQWICARCSRSVGLQDFPSRPTSHCPQCSDSNLTFVLDCSSNVHWTWCSRCQQRGVEVPRSPFPVPQSVGVSGWFSRGPFSHMGRLYGWGDSPITPPGGGPQSWLFCPLISLALESIEIARGVSRWSIGSRHPVPNPQREFWNPTALEIIQMFSVS